MNEATTARPHIPAPAIRQGGEFEFAMNQFIAETIRASLAHMIARENTLRVQHGRSWGDSKSYAADGGETLKETSAHASVHFDGIIRNDLSQLPSFLHSLVGGVGVRRRWCQVCKIATTKNGMSVLGWVSNRVSAIANLDGRQTSVCSANFKCTIHLIPMVFRKLFEGLPL